MKKMLLWAMVGLSYQPLYAQKLAWEVEIPDEKQRYSNLYPDLNNPELMYVSGDYVARQIKMDGHLGDSYEIGKNYMSELYFLSDASHVYSLIQFITYGLGREYSAMNLLYASAPGVSKGVRETVLNKEKYNDMYSRYLRLAGLHVVEGNLHLILGGGDYYNTRPKNSSIVVFDATAKSIKDIPVEFPMMEADNLVENRTDKGHYIFAGTWKEIAFDPETNEATLLRVSAVDHEATASLFTVNVLTGKTGPAKEIKLPSINQYVTFSGVSVIKGKNKNEFILQLILTDSQKITDQGAHDLMLAKYDLTGKLLGSKTHSYSELSGLNIQVLSKSDFVVPAVEYDSFSDQYVLIWNTIWGKPMANNMAVLDSEFNKVDMFPSVENVVDKKAEIPQKLTAYWQYYYSKGTEFGLPGFANIYFGDGFVLMKHHSNLQKKVTVACFK